MKRILNILLPLYYLTLTMGFTSGECGCWTLWPPTALSDGPGFVYPCCCTDTPGEACCLNQTETSRLTSDHTSATGWTISGQKSASTVGDATPSTHDFGISHFQLSGSSPPPRANQIQILLCTFLL